MNANPFGNAGAPTEETVINNYYGDNSQADDSRADNNDNNDNIQQADYDDNDDFTDDSGDDTTDV